MIILDGAMGTMIQATVPEVPKYAETLNLIAPEVITAIHRRYVEAGTQLLCTNTYTCNSTRAAAGGYDLAEVVGAAIENARTSRIGLLTRDCYHLSMDKGRFIAALAFISTITGIDSGKIAWAPENVDEYAVKVAIESVKNAQKYPFLITKSEI